MSNIMSTRYILDEDHIPVEEPDEKKFYKWFLGQHQEATVRETWVRIKPAPACVITVFLGYNHTEGEIAAPEFFRTKIMGPPNSFDEYYMTWDEAVVGHHRVVHKIRQGGRPMI